MLSWVLLILFFIVAIGLMIGEFKLKNNDGGMFVTGALFFIVACSCLGGSYYRAHISIPEEYKTVCYKIEEVKKIITNSELNLADMEMNKELADLIREKENLKQTIRINNKSFMALFKINIPELTIYGVEVKFSKE